MRRLLILALAVAGCGGDDAPPPVAPTAAVDLTEEAAGRTVVATVDGVPIYDDCVARQAAAHDPPLALRAAVDECIDFELLAQAAARAGLANQSEVLEVRRRETARRVIAAEFAERFDGPEDVPEEHLRGAYQQLRKPKYFRDREWREVQYVRAVVNRLAPTGWLDHWHAYYWMARLYRALKDQRPEDAAEFVALANQLTGSAMPLSSEPRAFAFSAIGPIERPFREASFTIAEPGQVHPPIRTMVGWDIIYLNKILPPVDISFEEAEAELRGEIYEASRAKAFQDWLASKLPAEPTIDDYWLRRLARADQAQAQLLTTGGARR